MLMQVEFGNAVTVQRDNGPVVVFGGLVYDFDEDELNTHASCIFDPNNPEGSCQAPPGEGGDDGDGDGDNEDPPPPPGYDP